MHYPIFLHRDVGSDYGVPVPDLPGCYTAGGTLEEAISNAHKAIECHLDGLLKDGESLSVTKSLDKHMNDNELSDAMLAIVDM